MRNTPLLARPRADVVSVEDLVAWVQQGRVRIPDFQRPLRWRAQHVQELFDSLWLGYPVGNLFFWQRPAPATTVKLGPLQIQAEARTDSFSVVDGQQRLTSLAAVLLHPNPTTSNGDLFALWFDLVQERFMRAQPGEDMPAWWLPMNSVLDAVRLGEWWAENPLRGDRTDLYRVALQVGKRIRESRIPVYTVETDDPDTLKVIFARMNTAGIQMRTTEVFNALHAQQGQRSPLALLSDVCVDGGMGRIEEAWSLRCLRAVADEALDTPPRRENEAYRAVVGPTSIALGAAIDFLRDECHVPHLRVLPYRLPVVTLTRFFHLHRDPSPRSKELLRRWFWRGVVNARHEDTGNPHLRFVTKAIDRDEAASVQRLLEDVGGPTAAEVGQLADRVATSTKRFSSAEMKIHAALLSFLGPLHMETAEALSVSHLFEELGPSALQAVGPSRGDCVLHPYLEDMAGSLNMANEEVQASHAWLPGADESGRRFALGARFTGLLLSWCAPGLTDVPPFADLFAGLGEE